MHYGKISMTTEDGLIEFPSVPARKGSLQRVNDAYNNFVANVGTQTDSIASYGTYTFTFLTRNRILLEAMYRGSWIIGAAIDMQADDMTQAGIEIQSDMEPDQIDVLEEVIEDLDIWKKVNSVIKWSRLYGSALGVYLIDGQDFSTPLDIETVTKDQFKGILPLDRWQLIPQFNDLVQEYGPDMGTPKYYWTVPDALLPFLGKIHHTRVFRLDCIELPHYQKQTENLWAESIIERIYDRLLAFDSTTEGAANLVFKSYLRTWKVKQLREILGAGGPAQRNLEKNVQDMRRRQSNDGLTLIDSEDEIESATYTFSGLDDILLRFGEQLAGALETPMVRLFGTSPKGMNATGESDLRTYYDNIKRKQKNLLRRPVKKILALAHRSAFGTALPEGFKFQFNPLWQITDVEKAQIAASDTDAIVGAVTAGVVERSTALKELKQGSSTNGMWTNITDEDIKDAENEPPLSEYKPNPGEEQGAENGEETTDKTGKKD